MNTLGRKAACLKKKQIKQNKEGRRNKITNKKIQGSCLTLSLNALGVYYCAFAIFFLLYVAHTYIKKYTYKHMNFFLLFSRSHTTAFQFVQLISSILYDFPLSLLLLSLLVLLWLRTNIYDSLRLASICAP